MFSTEESVTEVVDESSIVSNAGNNNTSFDESEMVDFVSEFDFDDENEMLHPGYETGVFVEENEHEINSPTKEIDLDFDEAWLGTISDILSDIGDDDDNNE